MGPALNAAPDPAFWTGRRVLLTGHTGFKGAWLASWLLELGADVMGLSLPEPVSVPCLWSELSLSEVDDVRGDITDAAWHERVTSFAPSVVLHLAAQPLVSAGWAQPLSTFRVNVHGTAAVLDLLGSMPSVQALVLVTTDKVYDPAGAPPYAEADALGGDDPYAASKAAAELVVRSWPAGAARGTARAGNVIGGGDWAADRLLPDLVRAWSAGNAPVLRHPDGVRPWQHVLEPLRGYLLYAQALAGPEPVPGALNFGPAAGQQVAAGAVASFGAQAWQAVGADRPGLDFTQARAHNFPETTLLTLDSSLAARALGWRSVLSWQEAVTMTLRWHVQLSAGRGARDLVTEQIRDYTDRVGTA